MATVVIASFWVVLYSMMSAAAPPFCSSRNRDPSVQIMRVFALGFGISLPRL